MNFQSVSAVDPQSSSLSLSFAWSTLAFKHEAISTLKTKLFSSYSTHRVPCCWMIGKNSLIKEKNLACHHSTTNIFLMKTSFQHDETQENYRGNDLVYEEVDQTELRSDNVPIDKLSPMMAHYVQTKRQLPGYLLLYRVGDFFECFFEDAILFSQTADLALTSKDAGKALGRRVPMAGVPHYVLEEKCKLLLERNIHVAVCDQVESALDARNRQRKNSSSKSSSNALPSPASALVDRKITRIITPGTLFDEALLSPLKNNYLMAISLTIPTLKHSSRGKSAKFNSDNPYQRRNIDRVVDVNADVDANTDSSQADYTNHDQEIEWGIAYTDVSTGEFMATQGKGSHDLMRELYRISPSEIIVTEGASHLILIKWMKRYENSHSPAHGKAPRDIISFHNITLTTQPKMKLSHEQVLMEKFKIQSIKVLGCDKCPLITESASMLVIFLKNTLERDLGFDDQEVDSMLSGRPVTSAIPLQRLRTYNTTDFMQLDHYVVRNLELVRTLKDGQIRGSLLWALDRNVTAMGTRKLRRWLLQPLANPHEIKKRQCIVDHFKCNSDLRLKLRKLLKKIADVERQAGRAGSHRSTPRELRHLAESLHLLPKVAAVLRDLIPRVKQKDIESYYMDVIISMENSQLQSAVLDVIQQIVDPAPITLMPSTTLTDISFRIIKSGIHAELDQLRLYASNTTEWIKRLEARERERTGMNSIKVSRLGTHGCVVRVPQSAMDKANQYFASYDLVSSTKTEVRFKSNEMRKEEQVMDAASLNVFRMEVIHFISLRNRIGEQTELIRDMADIVSTLDALSSFAELASERNYSLPEILDHTDEGERRLQIRNGRHPVVEQLMESSSSFVPNSIRLGSSEKHKTFDADVMILTGPNSSGKSCYLRQTGLIQIIAQIGCQVPAESAALSICDRVFTRVGAVDDLGAGQSTFGIEMSETAEILAHASPHSLVLLDEVGRGTAVADGLSIAWSVAEFLAGKPNAKGPRVIFATHYHELNELSRNYDNVQNFQVQVLKNGFSTHRVIEGGAYESNGIQTARNAGMPLEVIERSIYILERLKGPSSFIAKELKTMSYEEEREGKQHIYKTEEASLDVVCDLKECRERALQEGYNSAVREALSQTNILKAENHSNVKSIKEIINILKAEAFEEGKAHAIRMITKNLDSLSETK